jgi:hypothetical protein
MHYGDSSMINIRVPIRVFSTANLSEHWTMRYKRNSDQQKAIYAYWPKQSFIVTPCKVTLTRIAPRSLDDDNLAYAFKGIRDIVSDLIIPGFKPGRADGQKIDGVNQIIFEYMQEKGKTGEYAIRIHVYES